MQFIYSRGFKKEFSRLPIGAKRALRERLELFATDADHPILNRHRLKGEYDDLYSINITGDYRLIFEMPEREVCYLIAIGTHHKLYGK